MITTRASKLLLVVSLPEAVLAIFRERFDIIQGRLEDAASIRPDALICSIRPYRLDAAAIEGLPESVKAIGTYSVGYDHIDLEAAARRNIAVFNTPGVLANSVADIAMLLMLGAARRATESIALLRQESWTGWSPAQLLGIELDGKTLGILGMGDIGRRVARRASSFGMKVAYHNRTPAVRTSARYVKDPRKLVAESDVLLLAWPSGPETRRFISAETLALAKRTLIVVNIGRGDLVVDDDLIAALRDGRIFAAGLDVFDNEPDLDPRYLALPNAFLLPHTGSSTWEARKQMASCLVEALCNHQEGKHTPNRLI